MKGLGSIGCKVASRPLTILTKRTAAVSRRQPMVNLSSRPATSCELRETSGGLTCRTRSWSEAADDANLSRSRYCPTFTTARWHPGTRGAICTESSSWSESELIGSTRKVTIREQPAEDDAAEPGRGQRHTSRTAHTFWQGSAAVHPDLEVEGLRQQAGVVEDLATLDLYLHGGLDGIARLRGPNGQSTLP